jgi:histidinol-phosphate/aromatic aminotransferase/cobyric acid decarboxylase-like protein
VSAPSPHHALSLGPHGGDGERIAHALGLDPSTILDLSASMNPFAPDVTGLAADRLDALRRYPDPTQARHLVADTIGVATECLLLTNGGAEAISLLAQEVGGQVVEPEFSLHPRHAVTSAPTAPAPTAPTASAPRWRSNPHNPTGRLAGADEGADVWDEAFYQLATGEWTRGDAALATVGSLTKLFACPGLRLGYAIADADLIERLERRQPQWSVSSLAVALVPDLLGAADLPKWAAGIAELRRGLTDLLRHHGLDPRPSDANYLLCGAPKGFRERLLPHGIIVRDCASFGLPEVVRLAVPGPDDLVRLDDVLTRTGPHT